MDPLATDGLGPIGELLADPAIEIVFHDADYDLRLLNREYGYTAKQPVRHPHRRAAPQRARRRARRAAGEVSRRATRQAVSARRLVGATALARDARVRGVGHPLPAAAAGPAPAAAGGAGTARLGAGGVRTAGGHPADTAGPGRAGLAPAQGGEGAAREGAGDPRELWEWRDGAARRADRATFRILNNEPMLAMAKNPPTELAALKAIPGVSSDQAERRGRDILAAVRRGLELPESDLPRLDPPAAPGAGPGLRRAARATQGRAQPAGAGVRPGTGRGLSQRDAGGDRPAGPEDDRPSWAE